VAGFFTWRHIAAGMRVGLVALETSHTDDAPGTRRLEAVGETLADRGHEVTVFCTQWWRGEGRVRTVDGVDYHAVTIGLDRASFCGTLPLVLARHRPDVVGVRADRAGVVLAARAGAALARAGLVADYYGDRDLPDGRLTRAALSTPGAVVTPSELVRTRARERGAPDDRTSVVPGGIDFDRVARTEPSDAVDVAYAHRLDGTDNVESLLLGLAELRDRDWSARVIGDGPHREAYRRQAADLRIDDRVDFLGACGRERRLSVYRGAHAFVQTAFREQFAAELLWALACGCVGIVEYQARSSAHELVENYDRGFGVTDPQELADAIVASADLEHLTVDDSWAAYDHDAVGDRYLEVYEAV